MTALVGESGSGKSTVARLLAQLYPPTSGEIRLDGVPTKVGRGRAYRAYAGQVQLILQDPFSSLNPVHTVRYHLRRAVQLHGTAAGSVDDEVHALLARVNLTPPEAIARRYPHELSGGQRQRVAIARALAAHPRVLLADEPVSMLDVSIRLGMLNLLAKLRDEDDLAILYITHDIASARYFADEVMVMYAGQLVEGGPAEDVTQDPAHPYTKMLLDAAPDPDRRSRPEVDSHGDAPSLIAPPSGCRFHPRCPVSMPVCATAFPASTAVTADHDAHCWALTEGPGGRD